jgi:1,4-dihydroxy-2-naphthoate octaprenyltransferase
MKVVFFFTASQVNCVTMWQTIKVLFKMSRPAQLLLLSGVYIFGSIIALALGTPFNMAAFIIGLLVFIPTSASIHYANEYADFDTDARTERTPYSGGSGALSDSGMPRRTALIAAWASLLLASVLAAISWKMDFLPPLALVILGLGVLGGWMYSLPPLALAWHGWGEVTNAFLGGMLVPVYAYSVQTGMVSREIVLASLPFCLLVFNNLLATQWPDRQADAAVGKRTLVTRWSAQHLSWIYFAVASIAYLSLLLYQGSIFPSPVVWSSFLVLPVVIWGGLDFIHGRSPFSSVAAMVFLLIVQTAAWWATLIL